MRIVNMHAAKTRLSELIQRVHAGEDIVIARNGTPVAKLVRVDAPAAARTFGALAGHLTVTDAFFEPLPPDELDSWDR